MENFMPRVSIIVPVYNSEKSIEKCIHSIMMQDEILEIICINDGSTDSSLEMLYFLQENYVNMRVLSQENKGSGAARNKGILEANGTYLAFCDSDDLYVDEGALRQMVDYCEENHLMACCGKRITTVRGIASACEDIYINYENAPYIAKYSDVQCDYDYQNFIFNTEFVRDNKLFFPNYKRFQDPPFLVHTLWAAKRFGVVNTCLYQYFYSDIKNKNIDIEKAFDMLCGIEDNLIFAVEYELDLLYERVIEHIWDHLLIVLHLMEKDNEGILFKKLESINNVIYQKTNSVFFNINYYKTLSLAFPLDEVPYAKEKRISKLIENINQDIYIYGAGVVAKNFFKQLKKNGKDIYIKSFITTKAPNEWNDKQAIISIDEFLYRVKTEKIYIAANFKNTVEIINTLGQKNITNIVCVGYI